MAGHGGSRLAGAAQIRKSGDAYTIRLPRHVGEALYEQEFWYVGVVTEEGILFKPLMKIQPDAELPMWAKGGDE